MDWLPQRQQRIEQLLAKRHRKDRTRVLHEVSGSEYEGLGVSHDLD